MVSFASQVSVSSDARFVMVADDHVTMLVNDVAPSSELTEECQRPSESFSPFDEADCLDDTAVDREYTEDEGHQESLCMMGDVADSYEGRSMMTMDGVSVVCSGQTDEPGCCTAEQLSSTHEQELDQDG